MTDDLDFGLPTNPLERAKMLESELVAACEGHVGGTSNYVALRRDFMQDPALKPLLPDFVRTCRDLDHFWPYIKGVSPQWAPRRKYVRDALSRLFEHLEGANAAPVDIVASDVCKRILDDGGPTYGDKDELPKLY